MIAVITIVILDMIIIVITGMLIVISFTITILMITTTLSPTMVHATIMGVRAILKEIVIAPIAQVTLDLDTCVATTLGFA
jgi:hypothetical protein